jgi:hypothetical protein
MVLSVVLVGTAAAGGRNRFRIILPNYFRCRRLGFGPKLRVRAGFGGRGLGEVSKFQSFKVSEFQGFKVSRFQRFKRVQGFKLKIEVEFLQSSTLFEHYETLKL